MRLKRLKLHFSVRVGTNEIQFFDNEKYELIDYGSRILIVSRDTKEFAISSWTNTVYSLPEATLEEVLAYLEENSNQNAKTKPTAKKASSRV